MLSKYYLLGFRLQNLEHLIVITEKNDDGFHRFQDLQHMADREAKNKLAKISKKVQFDDAVNIQFTSGTTGNPKGATLTHHNVVNNAFLGGRRLGYADQVRKSLRLV